LALMMEGTALFRNVGNFTNRHGVTSRKAWIFMNTAVRTSKCRRMIVWRPGFDPRPVHVEFIVDAVVLFSPCNSVFPCWYNSVSSPYSCSFICHGRLMASLNKTSLSRSHSTVSECVECGRPVVTKVIL
jgi:hypothetical protein